MLEYSLFGQNPKVFHTVNLLLHIGNALLLLAVLRRLKINNVYLIGFILLFFTLSPLVTESVCWITERKDVLYTFFYLLSALQFLRYFHNRKPGYLALCFFFFLLSCLSKPMAVSLPLLFLIYSIYNNRWMGVKNLLFLLPFFITSLLFGIVSVLSIRHGATGEIPFTSYSPVQKVVLLASELGYYFFKPFIPVRQQLLHLFPPHDQIFNKSTLLVYALAGLVILCGFGYLAFKKKERLAGALFLSWLVFLLPVLQLYPNTHSYVSERYFYSSIIFPVTLLYLLLLRLKIKENTWKIALVLLVPLFATLTFKRSAVWVSSKTLFEQELKADDKNPYALNNLGYYYNTQGSFRQGYQLLQQAVAADGANAFYLNNYGWALAGLGQTDSAIVYFNKALRRKKDFVDAINNLGICYMQKSDTVKAHACFEKAYALSPNNNESLYNLGAYYLKVGQNDRARPLIRKAYELGNKSAAKYLSY